MNYNFKCTTCNYKTFIPKYRNNGRDYTSKGNRIMCPNCVTDLVPVKKEGFGTNFLRFQSSSPQQKQEHLKKRSHEHFKKNIAEKKRDMVKNK